MEQIAIKKHPSSEGCFLSDRIEEFPHGLQVRIWIHQIAQTMSCVWKCFYMSAGSAMLCNVVTHGAGDEPVFFTVD